MSPAGTGCSPLPVTACTVPTTTPAAVATPCVIVSTTSLARSRIFRTTRVACARVLFTFLTTFFAFDFAARIIFFAVFFVVFFAARLAALAGLPFAFFVLFFFAEVFALLIFFPLPRVLAIVVLLEY